MLMKVNNGRPYETLWDLINHKKPSLTTLKKLWLTRYEQVTRVIARTGQNTDDYTYARARSLAIT